MADDLSTYWKDLPSRETPLDAKTLNGWGELVEGARDTAVEAATEAQGAAEEAADSAVEAVAPLVAQAETARDEAVAHVDILAAPADEQVAAFVGGVGGGATRNALRARDRLFNVLDFGAKGDGLADDTAAIIAAEAAAHASNADAVVMLPAGTYRTSATVRFRTGVEGARATLAYYGSGTAVVVGDDSTPGAVTSRRRFFLPKVRYAQGGGWDGTSVGVKAVNLNTCDVYIPWVQEFETGLLCLGVASGFAYNTITLGWIGQNRRNVVLTQDPTGWCNQNTFIGGRLTHGDASGAVNGDPGAMMLGLLHGSATVGGPNNNTFVGTSMEGGNWSQYRIHLENARWNTFVNCRYECLSGSTEFPVLYADASASNRILGGFDSWRIVETFSGTGTTGGVIYDDTGSYAGATAPAQVFANDASAAVKWNAPTSRRVDYNASTGEFTPRPGRWLISATVTFQPNATGRRRLLLVAGGSVRRIVEAPGSAIRSSLVINEVVSVNGAQTFRLDAHQTSGGDLALESSPGYSVLSAQYLPS